MKGLIWSILIGMVVLTFAAPADAGWRRRRWRSGYPVVVGPRVVLRPAFRPRRVFYGPAYFPGPVVFPRGAVYFSY